MQDSQQPDQGVAPVPAEKRGRIAKMTAVIGGVTLFIGALVTFFDTVRTAFTSIPENIAVLLGRDTCKPEVRARSFRRIPYSLYYTINSSRGTIPIYWFHLYVNNECPFDVHAIVKFKAKVGSVPIGSNTYTFSVLKGHPPFDRRLDPGLKFNSDDPGREVTIEYALYRELQGNGVEDKKTKKIDGDVRPIEVLQKRVFLWDLEGPEGPVDKKFLLASLSAWTQPQQKRVIQLGKSVVQKVDGKLDPERFADQWMEVVVQELFRQQGGLLIDVIKKKFTGLTSVRTIAMGGDIINAREGDALEVALLVGALARQHRLEDRGMRLVMYLLPREDGEGLVDVYLGWGVGKRTTKAMDVQGLGSGVGLPKNVDSATRRVRDFMERNPDVPKRLAQNGVFLDLRTGAAALDFRRAREQYHIRGLP